MHSPFANDDLLTQGLVADILSVSKQTVRDWDVNGTLKPFSKDQSGAPLYRWSDLSEFPVAKWMNNSSYNEDSAIMPERPYRSIELFAGAGGLAIGLEKAGFEALALNELDRDACQTLIANRPQWNVVAADVSKVDFSHFQDIDLVAGGFPCQAFSYAGNKFGFDDARGTLFFEFARVIRETKPRIFLGENVRGLLTHDGGKTLEVIRRIIKEIGYTLVEPHVLKAIFYRVPQKRERLMLVGIRNDLASYIHSFRWPSPAQRVYTVRDALMKGPLFNADVPASEGAAYTQWRAEILKSVPPGGYWRDLPLALQKKLLKNSFHLEGGKTGIGRRLSWDEPSLTLTCAPAQNQTGRCHPSETRPLTVREYARIQTFPDEWEFCGALMSQYKQIGNAVPVNLAEAIGHRLVALLNDIEKEHPLRHNLKGTRFLAAQPRLRLPDGYYQDAFLEDESLYAVLDSPVTLLGTYRKSCLSWIKENNLYNFPVSETELDTVKELLAVRRLILKRKTDAALFFKVSGYSIVDKARLATLGYKIGRRHPASQKYILYTLNPIGDEVKLNFKEARQIAGKGMLGR